MLGCFSALANSARCKSVSVVWRAKKGGGGGITRLRQRLHRLETRASSRRSGAIRMKLETMAKTNSQGVAVAVIFVIVIRRNVNNLHHIFFSRRLSCE